MNVELRRATESYFRDVENHGSVKKAVRKLVLFSICFKSYRS